MQSGSYVIKITSTKKMKNCATATEYQDNTAKSCVSAKKLCFGWIDIDIGTRVK